MPAPFPPSDTAIVRYRLTRAIPAGPLQPNPLGPSFPNVPSSPERPVGHEETETFELSPPTGDIAEVERQWREANPLPESGKDWQDAMFPGPVAMPRTPTLSAEPLDVDAQGLRHRAAGQEELPATVTEGVPVPGRGVGFADKDAADKARSRRGKKAAGGDGLDDLTVPELRERAKAANVPNTSTLNKAKLLDALRAAPPTNAAPADQNPGDQQQP